MPSDPLSYYDNVNLHLLGSIPPQANHVLEVGCGTGALGAAFKKVHPQCVYRGIEIVESAADIAAKRLDHVYVGAVETIDLSPLQGDLDCIVYGDVLEHLVDPWEVLATHRPLLNPAGKVIACIPNVQHWSVLANLLCGQWSYKDQGLLDRTHLRFFTLGTIRAMFEESGYKIESAVGRVFGGQDSHQKLLQALDPALSLLDSNKEIFSQQSLIFQYIVTASPA